MRSAYHRPGVAGAANGYFLDDYTGLIGLRHDFAAVFALAHPLAPTGDSNIFFARLGLGSLSTPSAPARYLCSEPSGRLAWRTLGPVSLGMTRARARSRFVRTVTRGGRYMDFFCLAGIGIRAGYPSPNLLRTLPRRGRAHVRGRVLLLTANRYYSLRGALPGMRLAAVARRLGVGKAFHLGLNSWYLARGGQSRGVLKVRHGKIQEIGIAEKELTSTRAAAWRFLNSFG